MTYIVKMRWQNLSLHQGRGAMAGSDKLRRCCVNLLTVGVARIRCAADSGLPLRTTGTPDRE